MDFARKWINFSPHLRYCRSWNYFSEREIVFPKVLFKPKNYQVVMIGLDPRSIYFRSIKKRKTFYHLKNYILDTKNKILFFSSGARIRKKVNFIKKSKITNLV